MSLTNMSFVAIGICLLTACSEQSMQMTAGDMDESAAEFDDSDAQDTGTLIEDAVPDAEHWSLRVNLQLEYGAILPGTSQFAIDYWGDDQLICTAELFLDADTNGTIDSDPLQPTEATDLTNSLLGQWTVQLSDDTTCNEALPASFLLGIGPLDPQLIPSVIASDLNPETLNGVYIQGIDDASTLYVFGVIGTQSQYDGLEGPLTDAPIPDGTYLSEALYPLPLIAD